MQDYFPTVVQAVPMDNYHVQVYFDDGKIIDYDMSQHLSGAVFKPLSDISLFTSACTVMNGTLAWDLGGDRNPEKCVDIDPFVLYECSSINQKIA